MEAQIIGSTPKELSLSVKESDIGILYIIQHELLKGPAVEFAGVIVKHPLTNECHVRVTTSKGDPTKEIMGAVDSALAAAEDLKKLFTSKLRPN